jgi:hypothetical protein
LSTSPVSPLSPNNLTDPAHLSHLLYLILGPRAMPSPTIGRARSSSSSIPCGAPVSLGAPACILTASLAPARCLHSRSTLLVLAFPNVVAPHTQFSPVCTYSPYLTWSAHARPLAFQATPLPLHRRASAAHHASSHLWSMLL